MSRDPFDGDDEFESVGAAPRMAAALVADAIGGPGEGDDLDRVLAFQPLNDFGNANRLIQRFGDRLIYVGNIGWFAWDGTRWDREGAPEVAAQYAHQVASAIAREAKALREKPGKDQRLAKDRCDALLAWGINSGNVGRVNGMLSMAVAYCRRKVEELDTHPFLVTAPNGTINLAEHCELVAARREDMMTRRLGAAFNPKAQCPQFLRFLERIMPDDEMRAFLQRICGYCLTGSTREHKLFLFYGTGRNGKSTLVNTLRKVLGDYAMGSPVATFLAKREGSSGAEASPDLARLPGARLIVAAEPPEGARLDEARVKEITGGDTIVVRHLNQGFFEFVPVFKAIISTNHLPVIRGSDHGIWSRVNVVPFTVQIPDDQIDKTLEGKLAAEAEGILQWMLTGAEDWLAQGLNPPPKAVAAVENYRADEDPVGEFLKARCEITDKANPATGRPFEVGAKRLREAYNAWCDEEGLDKLSARTFGGKVSGRGIRSRKTNGNNVWIGLRLLSDTI